MSATVPAPAPTVPRISRNAAIVGSVVLAHGVGLWALNNGLLQRAIEVVVPAEILAEMVAPPPPPAAPPAPVPEPITQPPPPVPVKPRVAPAPAPRPKPAPRPAPAPQPLTARDPAPSAPAMEAAPPAPAPQPAPPPPPAPAPPAPPAPEVVVQPSYNAAYLNNPPPAYPAMSKRLGEAGRVIVRVLIGPDGRAQDARIQRSSGFDRLDQIALETARDRWRYRPQTRNGVAEAKWFDVPLNFTLDN